MTSSVDRSFREILVGETGEMLAVGFDEDLTRGLIEVLWEIEDPPPIRVLARNVVLKWVHADFVLAGAAAELAEAGRLALRTATERLENALEITRQSVVSLVQADQHVGAK